MHEYINNELLKMDAQTCIKKIYIDHNIYYVFEGAKFKYKNYNDAVFDCMLMMIENNYKKIKEPSKLSIFFKQLFCKHDYVCEKIIVPKGCNNRVHHYYLRCLKCEKIKIYERAD